MSTIKTLKAQAKNLKLALEKQGIPVNLSQAQEAVAQQHGVENWDTLCGLLKQQTVAREPVFADLPGVPDSVEVEEGPSSETYNVETYDVETLELLHTPRKLDAFLKAHVEMYPRGMDSDALCLSADGEDRYFSLRQLQTAKHDMLGGRSNWFLPDDDVYLRFNFSGSWTPPKPVTGFTLTVPELVKTANGCSLIALRSHDGSAYDHFAIVPPHLDAADISTKLVAGLKGLKQQDTDNQDNPDYQEYTDVEVRTLVESLKCTWAEPTELGINWDA